MKKSDVRTEEDVKRFLKDKTEFERNVLVATYHIPKGKVSTYKRIAEKAGKPKAHRAAAHALHNNPLHPIVPCHRVVKSDGSFGGNEKAAEDRRKQVIQEGVRVKDGKVQISKENLY